MPCWTVTTVAVNLNTADMNVLKKAIEAELGSSVSQVQGGFQFLSNKLGYFVTISNGKMRVRQGDERYVNDVNKAYSKETIRSQASRFNWKVKQISEDEFEVEPRF